MNDVEFWWKASPYGFVGPYSIEDHDKMIIDALSWNAIPESNGLYDRPVAELEADIKDLKDQIGKGEKDE